MLRNYLKSAYRNLIRTKVYSFINILGLAIGMTACLLILHYVNFERSYDKFHENYDRIYRLRYERTDESGASVKFASCTPPAAARIRGNYPEVENIARLLNTKASVSFGDIVFLEERLYFAEPEFFDIMSFKFIERDPNKGIEEPNRAYISASTARKYFGDEDPIGKSLSINKRSDYEVVGIFEDVPQNSHIKFDIVLPWKNLEAAYGPDYYENWGHTGSYTYVLAKPGIDIPAFERKILTMVEAECPWLKEYNMTIDLKMQPMTDIHLNSHFMQEYEANGDKNSVNFLFIIAFFIIIMAWVNYINLSTARSLTRAREVGLRKVVGASRGQLIMQFFIEIIIINFSAVLVSVLMIYLVLPFFGQITGVPLEYSIWNQSWFWLTIAGMFVVGVVLSGLYPVMAMSSYKPVKVLKGKLGGSARGINLRKALVVFQFTVGLFLIIATLTVYKQLSYMSSQELGFNMEQTMVIKAPMVRDDTYNSKFDSFKQTLLQRPQISKISHVTEVPGRQIYWDAGGIRKAGTDVNQGKNYQIVGVDYDFIDLFDLELAAGRGFSREFPSDKDALILNETAVKFMGFDNPESAVGQEVDYWGQIYPIIGVLKDYHQQSLKQAYEPHIFRFEPYGRGRMGMIAIKLNTDHIQETIGMIKNEYNAFFPGNSIDFFFLDDYYNQQYKADELFGRVYSIFTILAIIVTLLGIYGLSSFMVTQMTKEIGIRKVLGASITSIVGLLTREFLILIAIANIIAWPSAYLVMNGWLESFAFRTNIGVWLFIGAGLLTMIIALLTLSYQVIKAATANPVKAIQYE